jgi:hypothetical protein
MLWGSKHSQLPTALGLSPENILTAERIAAMERKAVIKDMKDAHGLLGKRCGLG